MKNHKNSQAAMEFMLTYGWAIVVVITAVGALAYFGVLNPLDFTPNKCTFSAGLHCQDFEINEAEGKTTFSIRNDLGGKIEDVKVSMPGCTSWSSDVVINDGEAFNAELDCSIGEGKFNFEPVVSYTNAETGLRFTETGTITGKIGSGSKEAKPADADSCDEDNLCDESNECKILDGCFSGYCVYSDAGYGTLCNDKDGLCLEGECTDGLVFWWKLDEGEGLSVKDSVGSYDAALYNGPVWQPESDCMRGSCLSFDGIDDAVQAPSNPRINSMKQMTVSLWVRPFAWVSDTSQPPHWIYPAGDGFGIYTDGLSKWRAWVKIDGLRRYFIGSEGTLNEWQFVALTYDGNTERLYQNGHETGSLSYPGIPQIAGVLTIGNSGIGGVYGGNGLIDSVLIFNRSLSLNKIQALYKIR